MHHNNRHQHLWEDAESSTREWESPLRSQETRTRGRDWSSKVRSTVSVADLHLGGMTEEAELAAHANAWQPSVLVNQDIHGRAAQVSARHVNQRISAADHPTTAERSASLARPLLKARSLAQLQELMHFELGLELAGVTDRLTVFERRSLVIVRPQMARCWVCMSGAPHCWREFRRISAHICCSLVVHVQIMPS